MPIYELSGPQQFLSGLNSLASGIGERFAPLNAEKYANALNWEKWWDRDAEQWRPGTPLAFRLRDLISGKKMWIDKTHPGSYFYSEKNPGLGTPSEGNYLEAKPGDWTRDWSGFVIDPQTGKTIKVDDPGQLAYGVVPRKSGRKSTGTGQSTQPNGVPPSTEKPYITPGEPGSPDWSGAIPTAQEPGPFDMSKLLSMVSGLSPASMSLNPGFQMPKFSTPAPAANPNMSLIEQILLSLFNQAQPQQQQQQRPIFSNSYNRLPQPYARGGVAGTLRELKALEQGDDTVPAVLEPGEVVINKAAADAIGQDRLNALNKAIPRYATSPGFPEFWKQPKVPGYASGGKVRRYAGGGEVAPPTEPQRQPRLKTYNDWYREWGVNRATGDTKAASLGEFMLERGATDQEIKKIVPDWVASGGQRAITGAGPTGDPFKDNVFWNPDFETAYNFTWPIQNAFQRGVDSIQGWNQDRQQKLSAVQQDGRFKIFPITEAFGRYWEHNWKGWQDIDKLDPKNSAWIPEEWTDKDAIKKVKGLDTFYTQVTGGGPFLLNGQPVRAQGPDGKTYVLIQKMPGAKQEPAKPEPAKPTPVKKEGATAGVVGDQTKPPEQEIGKPGALPEPEVPVIDWGTQGGQGAALTSGQGAAKQEPIPLYHGSYGYVPDVNWSAVNKMDPGSALAYLTQVANTSSVRPEQGGNQAMFNTLLAQYKEQQGVGLTQAQAEQARSSSQLDLAQAANAKTVNELNQIEATIKKQTAPMQIASAKYALQSTMLANNKANIENFYLNTLYTNKDYMNAALAEPIVKNALASAQAEYYKALSQQALTKGDTTMLRFSINNIIKSQKEIMDSAQAVAMGGKKDYQIKEYYKQYLLYKFMAQPQIIGSRTPEQWATDAAQAGGFLGSGKQGPFLTKEEVQWVMNTAMSSYPVMAMQLYGISSYSGVPEDVAAAVMGE